MHTAGHLLKAFQKALDRENYHREPLGLYEPIGYILSLGGKRIRPVMLLMAADIYGGDIQRAMPAALGIEIFHNFSLIHDDIMDRAPIRRGKMTVHEKWNTNTAILSGDTMLIKAYEQFLKLPESLTRPAFEIFNHTATWVCEGQQMDMDFEAKSGVTILEYLEMIRLKTAVLIGAALKLGSLCAGAPEKDQVKLFDFGVQTGLMFQLRDDLLDAYGDTEAFGKKQFGDIIAHKKTYLYLRTLENLAGKDREKFSALYDDHSLSPATRVKKVMEYFDAAEVKKLTGDKINELHRHARKVFDSLKVPEKDKRILKDFTEMLTGRSF